MKLFNQLSPLYQDIFKNLQKDIEQIEERLKLESVLIPNLNRVFYAYSSTLTPKVIILGQDPYPNPEHATGIAFSVPRYITSEKMPPTLKNIKKELLLNYPKIKINTGSMENWLSQGVLLINTRHTLSKDKYLNTLWDRFTDDSLKLLSAEFPELVVISWGKKAERLSKRAGFNNIITSPHPSPLSSYRGFFNSQPFIKCNRLLKNQGKKLIDWDLI